MRLFGILFREAPDLSGETIKVSGADLTAMIGAPVSTGDQLDRICGTITAAYKVPHPIGTTDEDNDLYIKAGGPFVKIEIKPSNDRQGMHLATLAKDGMLYFGAYGSTIRRDGQVLSRTIHKGALLTPYPADPITVVRTT